MCRVYIQHFSHHDVRPRMSIQPFSQVGEGDYIDPVRIIPCRCETVLDVPYPWPSAAPAPFVEPPIAGLDICRDHDCCVIWDFVELCQWAHNWVMNGNPNHNPHIDCPNLLITNKYRAVQTVMGPDPATGERAQPIWEEEDLPTFPMDMFYSRRVLGDDDQTASSSALRLGMVKYASSVYDGKMSVITCIEAANTLLRAMRDNIRKPERASKSWEAWLTADLAEVQNNMGIVSSAVLVLELSGELVIDILGNQRSVLEFMDKIPDPGGVAAAADGSYQVSRERLDLTADDKDVLIAEMVASDYWKRVAVLRDAYTELQNELQNKQEEVARRQARKREREQQVFWDVEAIEPKRRKTTSGGWIGGSPGHAGSGGL